MEDTINTATSNREVSEENEIIQQMEIDFGVLQQFVQKFKQLLDQKIKRKTYPTKSETEEAILSVENLLRCNEEIEDDVKLLIQFLNFARARNWKSVKNGILAVCMELDAAETKHLKRDSVVSMLIKPHSVELSNFDVWTECAVLRLRHDEQEVEELDVETEEIFEDPLPTEIAKQFCNIYDVDWTEAFNQTKTCFGGEKEDEELIKDIAVMTQLVFDYTKDKIETQINNMALAMTRVVIEPIKQKPPKIVDSNSCEYKVVLHHAMSAVKSTVDFTLPIYMKDFVATQIPRKLKSYITLDKVMNLLNKCAHLAWRLGAMEQPLVLLWPGQTSADKLFYYFRYFTKFGTKLEHCVWPALLLYKDGPIMVKGVAQLK